MICTHCGRILDAQAQELGACRYCGYALTAASDLSSSAGPGSPPFFPDDATRSHYDWKDWPTASALPGAGATLPTLPGLDGSPTSADVGGTTTNNALTLPGGYTFAPGPPNTVSIPGGAPPQVGMSPFGMGAPQASPAAPTSPSGTPPRRPPAAPGRWGRGRLLALAGLVAILLVVLIGSGFLFARNFNTSASNAGRASSTAAAIGQPTARPISTSTARPTATFTPAPTATPTPIPFKTYKDPSGFSIDYPPGWMDSGTSLTLGPDLTLSGEKFTNGQATFTIATSPEPVPIIPPDQADNLLLTSQGVNQPGAAQTVTIGGQGWTEKSGDSSAGNHVVVDSINFNGRLYLLWYSAPMGEFATDNTQAFSRMIQSFSFGG